MTTPSPLLAAFVRDRVAQRLGSRDFSLFSVTRGAAEVREAIGNRLGWLAAPEAMLAGPAADAVAFAAALRQDGLTDVYLLGMGGSSLCAEVLRDLPHPTPHRARLVVLDTTDERAIRDATESLVPERAFFLVSSKSGSTIEVTSLEAHFRSVMRNAGSSQPGRHFAAITDPGTSLVTHAAQHGYRQVFLNPADIGGRYSALSLFGLVPAAVLGLDVEALLSSAERMRAACGEDGAANPGLALGAFMAEQGASGRDKLTLLAAPPFAPLGAWIEQLVAESTGKIGRGILPVVDEPIAAPAAYGPDRAFVALVTPDAGEIADAAQALEAAGHPVFRIESTGDAGAEFFRWEFATAVAGIGLDVNPFDEPNVRQAKTFTKAQLDARQRDGAFRLDPPLAPGDGESRRIHRRTGDAPDPDHRYIAILDYLPADTLRTAVVAALRATIREQTGLATTYGIGPRYLHSTGQYHKGGPNTGAFLLITAGDDSSTPVPEADFSFSVLKHAQALGDFDALVAAGREVIHYHFADAHDDIPARVERAAMTLR